MLSLLQSLEERISVAVRSQEKEAKNLVDFCLGIYNHFSMILVVIISQPSWLKYIFFFTYSYSYDVSHLQLHSSYGCKNQPCKRILFARIKGGLQEK